MSASRARRAGLPGYRAPRPGDTVVPGHELVPDNEGYGWNGVAEVQDAALPLQRVTWLSSLFGDFCGSMLYFAAIFTVAAIIIPVVTSPDAVFDVNGTCLLETCSTANPDFPTKTLPGTGCYYPDWLNSGGIGLLIIALTGYFAKRFLLQAFGETAFCDFDFGLALTSTVKAYFVAGETKAPWLRLLAGVYSIAGAVVGALVAWAFQGGFRGGWRVGGKGMGVADFGVQYRYYLGYDSAGDSVWSNDAWIGLLAAAVQGIIVVVAHHWSERQESYFRVRNTKLRNEKANYQLDHEGKSNAEGVGVGLANFVGGGVIGPFVGLSGLTAAYLLQLGTLTSGARCVSTGWYINLFVLFIGYLIGHVLGLFFVCSQHWIIARINERFGIFTDVDAAAKRP